MNNLVRTRMESGCWQGHHKLPRPATVTFLNRTTLPPKTHGPPSTVFFSNATLRSDTVNKLRCQFLNFTRCIKKDFHILYCHVIVLIWFFKLIKTASEKFPVQLCYHMTMMMLYFKLIKPEWGIEKDNSAQSVLLLTWDQEFSRSTLTNETSCAPLLSISYDNSVILLIKNFKQPIKWQLWGAFCFLSLKFLFVLSTVSSLSCTNTVVLKPRQVNAGRKTCLS